MSVWAITFFCLFDYFFLGRLHEKEFVCDTGITLKRRTTQETQSSNQQS